LEKVCLQAPVQSLVHRKVSFADATGWRRLATARRIVETSIPKVVGTKLSLPGAELLDPMDFTAGRGALSPPTLSTGSSSWRSSSRGRSGAESKHHNILRYVGVQGS
jgi:hypothetical protein